MVNLAYDIVARTGLIQSHLNTALPYALPHAANGLQWSDIDSAMVLRKTHTKTGAYVEFDLKLYPAVLEEIERVPREKRIGPMIISERTGEPYKHRTFTQTWRKVANKAGVPKAVWNMDARAGAISEAYDAGAGETDVMKHAGHKNRQTSARYNRGSLEQTSRVARLRLAKRSENKSRRTHGGRVRDVKRRTLNRKENATMHYSMRNCSLLSNPIEARQ